MMVCQIPIPEIKFIRFECHVSAAVKKCDLTKTDFPISVIFILINTRMRKRFRKCLSDCKHFIKIGRGIQFSLQRLFIKTRHFQLFECPIKDAKAGSLT